MIEWSPCNGHEICPAEQRLEAGAEKRLDLLAIATDRTESVSVFWWYLINNESGDSTQEVNLIEVDARLPSGWR